MKNLLNLGVSGPLTLGMAHPIADRLETLGRARPTTWRSRILALSAMGVLVIASAPLSIAADEAEKKNLRIVMSETGVTHAYEVRTENGVNSAYRILDGGKREAAKIETNEDGVTRLVFSDGQTVDLPKIDLSKLGNLKSLEGLEGLEGLSGLKGFSEFPQGGALDISEAQIRVYNLEDSERIVRFPTTIVDGNGDDGKLKIFFEEGDNSLASAKRQLERTQKQLEAMAENENLTFDLENALRDIENARKSLEAAESRLTGETE